MPSILWAQDTGSEAQSQPPLSADDETPIMYREIVVTARRRDERLQDVPVSVSAFSAEALARSTIQTVADINTITPGFRAGAEGGKKNASISLRGIGQVPLGEASPGVVPYFSDIPLPSFGSNIPTFNFASLQVCNAPQGTLFGRNPPGGAALISPHS